MFAAFCILFADSSPALRRAPAGLRVFSRLYYGRLKISHLI